MRWRAWRAEGRSVATLVGECEAFLTGRAAERAEQLGTTVPVWAWTNLLAHGTERDLEQERTVAPAPRFASSAKWREARSYLAAEVLALAEEHGPLTEVQRALLVPLELDLGSRREVTCWGPRQWVAYVRDALVRHRRGCERRLTGEAPPSR